MARINIISEITGKVWKIQTSVGADVSIDEQIMIVESMKMEIPVCSTDAGRVIDVLVKEGDSVEDGQIVAVVETR